MVIINNEYDNTDVLDTMNEHSLTIIENLNWTIKDEFHLDKDVVNKFAVNVFNEGDDNLEIRFEFKGNKEFDELNSNRLQSLLTDVIDYYYSALSED